MKLFKRTYLSYLLSLLMVITAAMGCGRQASDNTDVSEQTEMTEEAEAAVTEESASVSFGSDAKLTITAIKEGAADAFVLMWDGYVAIIDTGLENKADKLVDFLTQQGVNRVDYLIISHFDKDHVGGADHILKGFEVGEVYSTYRSKDSDDIESYMSALEAAGLTEKVVKEVTAFEEGGVSFTIYPPRFNEYAEKTSNNSSLAVRVSVGENAMLFAGDAEAERIKELLATEGLESVILKVPHHGRLAANTEALIKYVSPKYAVVTSSSSEPEDQEVVDILKANGVSTYFTKDGNITITMTASEVEIDQ